VRRTEQRARTTDTASAEPRQIGTVRVRGYRSGNDREQELHASALTRHSPGNIGRVHRDGKAICVGADFTRCADQVS
jgi:hypothetical protein